MFPKGQTNLSTYAVYFLIYPPCDWRGARVLSIPFIKQHLLYPLWFRYTMSWTRGSCRWQDKGTIY